MPTAALSPAPFPADGLLLAVLEASLTGVNLCRPLYPAGPPAEGAEPHDFSIEYLNPAAQRMLGLPEQPGATVLSLFPATADTGVLAFHRRVYATGQPEQFSLYYQADGLDNYFHLSARRHDEWLVVSFNDTADQNRSEAELALRQAQNTAQAAAEVERQRLLGLLMGLPAIIASYRGPQHVYELVSPGFQMLFPDRKVVGRPIREALPELEGQQYFELLDHVYTTGEPFYGTEMESWVDFSNTGKLEVGYFNVFFQATRDPQGRIDGLLSFAYDVTEQVLARQRVQGLNLELGNTNEELAAANEELQAANEELQHNNSELLHTQQQLHRLNDELEARIAARTADAQAARAEAERQRARLERLFKQAPAYITIYHGPELVFEFVHPQMQALMGKRTLLGLPRRQALPEMPEESHALFEQVYQTGVPAQGFQQPTRFDWDNTGKPYERYFDFTYQAVYDEVGEVEGVMSFSIDVTEQVWSQRQAEALQQEILAVAQRQVQERDAFYHVFEQTPALVQLLRAPNHHIEYVNPAYQRLFPGRQLVGLDLAEAVPELREQGFITLMDEVYRTGQTYFGNDVRFVLPADDGQSASFTYFNFTYQAYRENGEIAGISVFAYDVTEQVMARQQREAQQERLERLFMQAPAAICILAGPELVYELVNPGYQRLFPGRQLLGRPLAEALPEIVGHAVYRTFRQVYETGITHEEYAICIPLTRPDGVLEDRYFNYIQQARLDAQGRPDGVLVFAFEVTEHVLARQEVQQLNTRLTAANQQLTRTNTDLDTFIYTASHDLKAPITNIEGLLTALHEQLPPAVRHAPEVRPLLTMMHRAVARFQLTIAQLTDISKLQESQTQPAETVDLATLVEFIRLDLTPRLTEAQATLTVDVTACRSISFAPQHLRSILYNLLSNALKYRHPERLPHISLHAFRDAGGAAVLQVQDNGLGLSSAQQSQLFGLFQRLHTHVDGSGVGLYMVKKIVENAGGRVSVESKEGVGSTFTVVLPQSTM